MNTGTFAERFCADNHLARQSYEEAVFDCSLYPSARWLKPLLEMKRGHFTPDREFISSVGRITSPQEFHQELIAFVLDPNNRGFLRRVLKLRISGRRLQDLVHSTLRETSRS